MEAPTPAIADVDHGQVGSRFRLAVEVEKRPRRSRIASGAMSALDGESDAFDDGTPTTVSTGSGCSRASQTSARGQCGSTIVMQDAG